MDLALEELMGRSRGERALASLNAAKSSKSPVKKSSAAAAGESSSGSNTERPAAGNAVEAKESKVQIKSSSKKSSPKKKVPTKTNEAVNKSTTPEKQASSSSPKRQFNWKDKQVMEILNNFRFLELALNKLGKRVATWGRVREYVQSLSTTSFDMEDLVLILSVWPEGYKLDWRMVALDSVTPAKVYLCMNTANIQNIKTISRRAEAFQERILDKVKDNGRGDVLAANMHDFIPKEPSRSGFGSNFTQSMLVQKTVLNTINIMKEGNGEPLQIGLNEEASKKKELVVVGGSQMDTLREMAKERGVLEKSKALAREKERKKIDAERRIRSIPAVCDALRSISLVKNRQSQASIMSEMLRDLAPDLSITEQELLARFQIIAREMPHFLSIFAPDSIVAASRIKVNLHVPYAELRKKAQVFVTESLSKIQLAFS